MSADDITREYLERVDRAASMVKLPEARRVELREELAAHLHQAAVLGPADRIAAVREAIASLGDPEAIVVEAAGDEDAARAHAVLRAIDVPRPTAPGFLEVLAIGGIGFGWLAFGGIGSLAGVVALLASRRWGVVDKLLAVWTPLGPFVAAALYVTQGGLSSFGSGIGPLSGVSRNGASPHSSVLDGFAIAGVIIGLVLPLAAAGYLAWRLRARRGIGASWQQPSITPR